MQSEKRRGMLRQTFVAALISPIICVSAIAASMSPISAGDSVSTIVGDGSAGYRDGDAAHAQFMLPAALAAGPGGAIYIADAGSNQIRMLRNGVVSTIAGMPGRSIAGTRTVGDFKDGPALEARFNQPMGLAVDIHGAIYIADQYNHCIRVIRDGVVSTFAGSPVQAGTQDGFRATATFQYPRSISFDADGNLYVADYGFGIRKISANGFVSTIALPTSPPYFTGISAVGVGANLTLYIANEEDLIVYRPQETKILVGGQEGTFRREAHPYGVYGLNDHEALIVDERSNVIRLYRGAGGPLISDSVRPIAGIATEDPLESSGFRDGPVEQAKFLAPLDAIVIGQRVIVADAGNRRVRELPLPSLRGPIGPRTDELRVSSAFYRVALVSNSMAFFNSEWEDSIAGLLENQLNARGKSICLPKPAYLSVVRIDAAGYSSITSYVNGILSSGFVDLIVLLIDQHYAVSEMLSRESRPPLVPDLYWSELSASLRKMESTLRANGTRLVVVAFPSHEAISPLVLVDGHERFYGPGMPFDDFWSNDQQLFRTLDASGVPYISLNDDFLQLEQSAHDQPLFNPLDAHFTRFGNGFIADKISAALERQKPWISPAANRACK